MIIFLTGDLERELRWEQAKSPIPPDLGGYRGASFAILRTSQLAQEIV